MLAIPVAAGEMYEFALFVQIRRCFWVLPWHALEALTAVHLTSRQRGQGSLPALNSTPQTDGLKLRS